MLRRDSVEVAEVRHPILVQTQRLQADSEGAGRFRGAPGAYVEYGPVGCAIKVAYGADGVENPALGARGGLAGGPSLHFRRDRTGELHELPPLGLIDLQDGERIVSVTAGGGGYGPPEERSPERVRHDVAEGWISVERARNVYRVALNDALEIDDVRTRLLRGGTA
jgi:N-methylhydantoinase B